MKNLFLLIILFVGYNLSYSQVISYRYLQPKKGHSQDLTKGLECIVCNNDYSILSVFGDFLDINGFFIIKEDNVIKKVFLEDRKLYGEPSLSDNNCIICYTYDNNMNSYLYIYDIIEDKSLEFILHTQLIKGFHSIFIKK